MRVGIASVRGAPGVSVLTAALACAAPQPLLVVEADPAGSAVTPRWGWPESWTDVARLSLSDDDVDAWETARPWLGGSRILVAGSSPQAMADETTTRWLVHLLTTRAGPTVVDVGRLRSSRHGLDLLDVLDEVWLVLDHDAAELTAARSWMPALASRQLRCRVLLRDRVPWPDDEVAATLGVPVSGRVPTDHRAAAALSGRDVLSDRLVRRSALVRACVPWAEWVGAQAAVAR